MKLSDYAKQVGVTYKTAYRWFKSGKLPAYQLDTGTIIVTPPRQPANQVVALYARISSTDPKEELQHQIERLQTYAIARGYIVGKIVGEVGSGFSDHRPKLLKLLADSTIGLIVVERQDRLTRFGFNYISQLMESQGRRVEIVLPSETEEDLMDDFVEQVSAMASKIYGRRNSKKLADKIRGCIEKAAKVTHPVPKSGDM